jgi:hypothetical protein
VWLVDTGGGFSSSLLAYDGLTGANLYDSAMHGAGFQGGRRFTSPIVADGQVFIGAKGVLCYGLKGGAK